MDLFSECSASSPEYDYFCEDIGSDDDFRPHTLPRAAKAGGGAAGRIAKKVRPRSRSMKEQKRASPAVLSWLEENYYTLPGSCLPRSVLYTHYQDFCKRNHLEPSSAASFGKVIRIKFPNLTTRRLGTRGQSKYHYYGLAIRESSPYYRSSYSQKGLTRFSSSSTRREAAASTPILPPTSKPNVQLPEFVDLKTISFSEQFPVQKMETFLLMYRAHCQRILDSVARSNFEEVQEFLIHFWQGMPSHVFPILSCQVTLDLIVVCDFTLYKAICEALIPSTLQGLTESLIKDMYAFTKDLVEGLFRAVSNLPATIGIIKVQTAELFGKSLRRQLALVHLAKGARSVLSSSDFITTVLSDLRRVEFSNISQQIGSLQIQGSRLNSAKLVEEFATELEQLLVKQSAIEVYFEWLDSLAEREMNKISEDSGAKLEVCQELLTLWTFFTTCLEKELVSTGGKSHATFRSLQMLLNEYMYYVTELVQAEIIDQQYHHMLRTHANPSLGEGLCSASTTTTTAKPVAATASVPPPPPPSLSPPNQLSLSIQPHLTNHNAPPFFNDDHDFLQKYESPITREYQDVVVKEEPGSFYPTPSSFPPQIKSEESYSIQSSSSPLSGSSVNSPCLPGGFDAFFNAPSTMGPLYHCSQASRLSGFDLDSGIDFGEDFHAFSGSLSSTSSHMDLQLPDMRNNSQYDYELLDLVSDPDKFLTDPFTVGDPMNDTPILQSSLTDPLH